MRLEQRYQALPLSHHYALYLFLAPYLKGMLLTLVSMLISLALVLPSFVVDFSSTAGELALSSVCTSLVTAFSSIKLSLSESSAFLPFSSLFAALVLLLLEIALFLLLGLTVCGMVLLVVWARGLRRGSAPMRVVVGGAGAGASSNAAFSVGSSAVAGASSSALGSAGASMEFNVGLGANSGAGASAGAGADGAGGASGAGGAWWQRLLRLVLLLAALGAVSLGLASCSSAPDMPEHQELVTDPVSFSLTGLSGDLRSNVEAHLNAMAVISKKRVFFYRREIQEVVQGGMKAFGYYHPIVKVELPDRDNEQDREVKITVDPGKPLFIRFYNVEILGEGAQYQAFSEVSQSSELGPYHILNHGAYENLKNAINQTALSLGFFDGQFVISRILVYQDQNFADIELIYDTGKRYKFGKLLMDEETEKLFRPSVNLQKFQQGDDFATQSINSFISSLNQTNYYNTVDVRPVLEQAEGLEVPLEVNLERRADNMMRLGGGVSTDEGLRLLFEWNKPLLNDRGDSFTSLTTLTMLTQDAQAIYKIPNKNPNLDYFTVNVAQTHTDFNDTLSNRSQFAVHYIANELGSWRRDYAIRVEYEDYDQASEYGRAFNIIPALRLTKRESSGGFDPSRGYSLMLEALGSSAIWGDNSFVQLKATYRGMTEITASSRFLFRLEQGINLGPDADHVPPSLRFFAGGDNSIRGFGYRNKASLQPDGSGLKGSKYLTTGTAEIQVPIGIPNSRVAFFVDAGIATDDYQEDYLLGPGLGYRFVSPYGVVRVDLAAGLEKHEPTSYHIHFAFGPEF